MVNPLGEQEPAEQQPAQENIQPDNPDPNPDHPDPGVQNNNNLVVNPIAVEQNAQTDQLPELRSKSTRLPSYVSFLNSTERVVDVYWVDYTGQCVHYKSVEPGRRLDLNTYETHPWVFRDHYSKAKLVVNNKEVFMPRHFPWAFRPEPSGEVCPKRVSYDITIPIYSLAERTMQVVLSIAQTEANINRLELPKSLREDLMKAVHHKNTGAVMP